MDVELIGVGFKGLLGVMLPGFETVAVEIDGIGTVDNRPALVEDAEIVFTVLYKSLLGFEARAVEVVLCRLLLRLDVGAVEAGKVESADDAVEAIFDTVLL